MFIARCRYFSCVATPVLIDMCRTRRLQIHFLTRVNIHQVTPQGTGNLATATATVARSFVRKSDLLACQPSGDQQAERSCAANRSLHGRHVPAARSIYPMPCKNSVRRETRSFSTIMVP